MKIMTEPLPRLQQVPEWLQQVVDKATAKKREDRFQSCAEFLQALKRETAAGKVEQPAFRTVYNEAPKVEAKTVVSTPEQQKTQITAGPQATQILEKPQTTQFVPPAQETIAEDEKPELDLNEIDKEPEKKSNTLFWVIAILVIVIGGIIWGVSAMFGSSSYSDSEAVTSYEAIIEDTTAIELDTIAVSEELSVVEEKVVMNSSESSIAANNLNTQPLEKKASYSKYETSIRNGIRDGIGADPRPLVRVKDYKNYKDSILGYDFIIGDLNGDGLEDALSYNIMNFEPGGMMHFDLKPFINDGKSLKNMYTSLSSNRINRKLFKRIEGGVVYMEDDNGSVVKIIWDSECSCLDIID
jgi:hypothetical protein